MFFVTTTTNRTESSPFWPYSSVLTSYLIAPLVVLILACISHILHRLLSPFLELHRTVSMDLSLTWMKFSDHFQVPYHYIYTLILPLFTTRDGLPSPCTLVYTVVFVVWFFRPYRQCNHISVSWQNSIAKSHNVFSILGSNNVLGNSTHAWLWSFIASISDLVHLNSLCRGWFSGHALNK